MDAQMSFTDALSMSGFEVIDFIILFTYIILLVSLGITLGHSRKIQDANEYFLAGNTLTWWAVGASLIAANISAEQIIGMSGTGFADGLAISAYEVIAAIVLVVIGKFLLPVMMDRKIYTIPQFLRSRYNKGVGFAFSILWLFLYVFVNLTSVAWLGALAIEQILGLRGIMLSIGGVMVSVRLLIILVLFLIAGLYSIHGGLASVAWTDVMQTIFIICGGLVTAYFAVTAVSGTENSFIIGFDKVYTYLTSGDHQSDSHFHLIIQRSHNESTFTNVPGLAAVVGSMWLTNFGYWAFNQFIIQKGLAAKSINDAQKGIIFAGLLKLIIPFIAILPGICAYYITQHPDYFTHIQGSIEVSDDAYPWLIRNFIPTGIKGLSLVAIIAAVISSLASLFNSTSTIFTIDIYRKHINEKATDKQLVSVGRYVALVALVLAAITVQPLMGDLDQAFQYIQEYSGFIYPGIIIVFSLGLLWKRATTTASIWTAFLTIPLGVLFKFMLPEAPFLFRAGYVFIILSVFFITVSLLSKKSVECDLPADHDRKAMMHWGYILGGFSILSIASAAVVTIVNTQLPAYATPENSTFAYLKDIGFQAFYFFGGLMGVCAFFLISNSKDRKMDAKAVVVKLSLFSTTRGYTYGTIVICVASFIFYALFW